MRIRKLLISVATVIGTLQIAFADQIEGIYGCSGYFSGYPNNGANTELKMTLKIEKDRVRLDGDYQLFGTNIINPLDGTEYLNCGMKYPPEFKAQGLTCDDYSKDGKMILQNFVILNMATMRLFVANPRNDSIADLDCVKTDY